MKNTQSYKAFSSSPYKSAKHTTYFDVYDYLFSPYIGKKITFVEIGVLGGGSLFMWREFFGPNARIIGVDLNPNAKKWEQEGFEIYIGSQSDEDFWRKFTDEVNEIDIVLDDGGHTYAQQIVTTEMLLPYIKDNGMLVVEDMHTSYMEGFGPSRFSFVEYTKNLIDKINLRFGEFDPQNAETRFWSVQFFESIISFHINKNAVKVLSSPVVNNGVDDLAVDYRNHGNAFYEFIRKLTYRLSFFKKIPGAWLLLKKFKAFWVNNTNQASFLKKYF